MLVNLKGLRDRAGRNRKMEPPSNRNRLSAAGTTFLAENGPIFCREYG